MGDAADESDQASDKGGSTDVEDQFRSLLEGLRTTLPGVQLITAFLLTLPLYDRFEDLSTAENSAYYVAFASALLSSLLLMAPSSHQRIRATDHGVTRRSQRHLQVAIRLTVAGTVGFAVAVTAVSFLVSSIVLNTAAAIGVAGLVAAVGAWSWFYVPLVTFERE